jgi:glycosyltransferase involved in cell wall biosynthesis
MAMGIPMVSFRLSETMRLASDTLTVAADHNPAALGDAIHELARNDALRAEKARQSREHAETHFVWEHQATKYVGVFESLLPRPPAEIGAPSRTRT